MASLVRRSVLWVLPLSLAAGCHSIFGIDEFEVLPPTGGGAAAAGGVGAGGGSGGTGNTGNTGATSSGGYGATGGGGSGATGGSGGCSAPSDCPGADTDCQQRVCANGVCGVLNAAADTPCDDDDGILCDGAGACVECNDPEDCAGANDQCINHQCAPPQCSDGQLNGNETDVDCGGDQCPTCDDGDSCLLPSDCTNDNCPADDLVCCNAPCDGECVACLDAKTGAGDGSCAPVSVNTDPDGECAAGTNPCEPDGTGCNGDAQAPGCNLLACTCTELFPVGGAILENCGSSAEGCDLRVNMTVQTCAQICQAHGSTCVTAFNDAPANTCGRDPAPIPCTYAAYTSAICVCSLG